MSKRVIRKADEAITQESVTAKIFMNGGSQAIRIPAKWKFETENVVLSYNPATGDITISSATREDAKRAFIELVRSLSEDEREEIKNWEISRDKSVPSIRPGVASFFRDGK